MAALASVNGKLWPKTCPPIPVVNHGFGGSKIRDAAYYFDRMVFPFSPQAVVLFSGTTYINQTRNALKAILNMKVNNKMIVVTGAGSGIGRALTLKLGGESAPVAAETISDGMEKNPSLYWQRCQYDEFPLPRQSSLGYKFHVQSNEEFTLRLNFGKTNQITFPA